jgi:hypothetical protein
MAIGRDGIPTAARQPGEPGATVNGIFAGHVRCPRLIDGGVSGGQTNKATAQRDNLNGITSRADEPELLRRQSFRASHRREEFRVRANRVDGLNPVNILDLNFDGVGHVSVFLRWCDRDIRNGVKFVNGFLS